MGGTPRKAANWSRDEVVNLLVNVDYYIRIAHYKLTNREGLVKELTKSTVGRQRGYGQIDNKLGRLCKELGDENRSTSEAFRDLLEHGTRSLIRAHDDLKLEVSDTLKALELDRANDGMKLRSASRVPNVSHTTSIRNSACETPSADDNPIRGTSTLRSQSTKPLFVQRALKQQSPSPSPISRTLDRVNDSKQHLRAVRGAASCETSSEAEDSNYIDEDVRDNSPVANSQPSRGTKRRATDYQPASIGYAALPVLDYNQPGSAKKVFERPILDENQELFDSLWRDNTYFRHKLKDSETKCKELQLSLRSHRAGDTHEIRQENKRLKRLDDLQTEIRLPSNAQARDSSTRKAIGKIRHQFEKMSQYCVVVSRKNSDKKYHHPEGHPFQTGSEDLRRLVQAVISSSTSALPPALPDKLQMLEGSSVEQIIHCLIGASIKEWVLKPPLRCTATLGTPLLEYYRDHIQTLSSEATLQAIEFKAYQSLFEDRSFQDTFVQGTADQLSRRLLKVLDAFMIEPNREENRAQIQVQLQQAFRCALEIKFQTFCCEDLFDTIWPLPGSSVERSLVTTEWQAHLQNTVDFEGAERLKVKVPLLPGIRRHRRRGDFTDLCSFNLEGREGLGKPETVCQGVIAKYE